MPIGDPYGSLEELKERLNIVDTDDDAALNGALAAASRAVNQFCGRQFQRTDTAEARTFQALSTGLLLVDDFHTTDDLSIDGTAFADGDFALEPLGGVVDGEPGWPFWRIRGGFSGRVEVTARWGWAAVPASITEAALVTAAEVFKLGDAPFGIQGVADMGFIRLRENHRVSQLLAPYQRRVVAVA
ncbi:phage head-tail connector protein [Nocardiopsis sp. CNT-189]|uniref:head-tail connector protein n=1 Tax=Nocardiopsis oceanisediminis TaxID=2816862 RepID=UPI003B2B10F3